MNKDQVKGEAKNIAGKAQEKMGKIIGSKEQQVKGESKQVTGKIQKGAGDVEQSVKNWKKN